MACVDPRLLTSSATWSALACSGMREHFVRTQARKPPGFRYPAYVIPSPDGAGLLRDLDLRPRRRAPEVELSKDIHGPEKIAIR